MEQGNVIDGRNRFRQQGSGNRNASLEERLASAARVPDADKRLLAINLGGLAERIDAQNPLKGAKRIFDAAGIEGLWQKRKRFIRLKGEAAPESFGTGEYGSTGTTFAQLAKAAGRLLATSHDAEAVSREQERAVRATLAGTSFLPTFLPLSDSERTAKSLIDEYAAVLAEAIENRTRITDLWAVLRDAPFGLNARGEEEEPLPESPFGKAAGFPESLLRPIFREHVTEAIFDPEHGNSFNWSAPTLELGFVGLRLKTRMFALPDSIARLFSGGSEDDDGFASEGGRWLDSARKGATSLLPDEDFGYPPGCSWKPVELSFLRKVGLGVIDGDDGRPRINLQMWGDEAVAAGETGWPQRDSYETIIAASGGRRTQLLQVDLDHGNWIYAVYSQPLPSEDGVSQVIGLIEADWEWDSMLADFYEGAWTEHPATAHILLGDEHRFIPMREDCEAVGGPLRRGSLGAALLSNARNAADVNSIPRLLIEKVRLTADAGLRFHESMVEDYREALRRI